MVESLVVQLAVFLDLFLDLFLVVVDLPVVCLEEYE